MRNRNAGGILAVALLGAYYLFRNREQVRDFLDRQGIELPKDTSHLRDQIRSNASRVADRVRSRVGRKPTLVEQAREKIEEVG